MLRYSPAGTPNSPRHRIPPVRSPHRPKSPVTGRTGQPPHTLAGTGKPSGSRFRKHGHSSRNTVPGCVSIATSVRGGTGVRGSRNCGTAYGQDANGVPSRLAGLPATRVMTTPSSPNVTSQQPASPGYAPACRPSCARDPTRVSSPTPHGRRCRQANWASSRRSPSSRGRRRSPS